MWVHRLSAIDTVRAVADCQGCGPEVPIMLRKDRNLWACAVGRNARRRRVRTPEGRRGPYLMARFGLTVAEYDELLANQDGVCAICEQVCSTGRRLAVDHDHTTGRIRGLLCGKCNRALGFMNDRPELLLRAAEYITN